MVQYAEAVTEITAGNWTATGTDCADSADCNGSPPTPDDSEYVTIDGADGGGYFEVKLGSITDPGVDTGFTVYLRERVLGGSGGPEKLDAYLYEGATLRATLWTNYTLTDNSFNTDSVAVAEADIANISDFTDLRVRVDVNTLGSGEDAQIAMILLEAPEAATAYDVSASDTSGISDSLAAFASRGRTFDDTSGLSDSFSRIASYARLNQSTFGLSDLVSRTLAANRSLSSTAGVSDSLTVELAGVEKSISVSDSAGISTPALSWLATIYWVTIPDTAGMSDSCTVALAVAATTVSVSDSAVMSDSLSRDLVAARIATDTGTFSDNIQTITQHIRSVSDSSGLSDNLNTATISTRQLSDTSGLSDVVTVNVVGAGVVQIQTQDAAALSDSLERTAVYNRIVNNTTGVTDTVQIASIHQRIYSSQAGLSDAVIVQKVAPISLTDSGGMTDGLGVVATYARSVMDNAGVAEWLAARAAKTRMQSDSAGLGDDCIVSLIQQPGLLSISAASTAGFMDSVTVEIPVVFDVGIFTNPLQIVPARRTADELEPVARDWP